MPCRKRPYWFEVIDAVNLLDAVLLRIHNKYPHVRHHYLAPTQSKRSAMKAELSAYTGFLMVDILMKRGRISYRSDLCEFVAGQLEEAISVACQVIRNPETGELTAEIVADV